jgi:glutaredoxin-like protein
MPLIGDKEKEEVRGVFAENVSGAVKLAMFTQSFECEFCAETRQLVEEVAALSDLVEADIYNFVTDKPIADSYGVDKIPAIVIVGGKDYGVRFYGNPSGFEFTTLIEGIIDVSRGESGLGEATKEAVASITTPVHMQVFITPT